MDRHGLLEADNEMQRLAFNLADILDTVNFHSLSEAVGDLRRSVFRTSLDLQGLIRRVLKRQDQVAACFPEADVTGIVRELEAMDVLLDLLHKCTGEVKNYKDFVDALIPLIRKCETWGGQGPMAACGAV